MYQVGVCHTIDMKDKVDTTKGNTMASNKTFIITLSKVLTWGVFSGYYQVTLRHMENGVYVPYTAYYGTDEAVAIASRDGNALLAFHAGLLKQA